MRLQELRMDWKVVTVIVVSTLVLVEASYHQPFTYRPSNGLFFYLVIPLTTIVLLFRESPAKYGFRLGDWKGGLLITVASCIGITLVMAFLGRTEIMRDYYGSRGNPPLPTIVVDALGLVGWKANSTIAVILENALDLIGWEFIFRGFLLFGLYRACGPYAIILQAVPFTIAHLGKPEIETLSCIFGGTAFGYVAWRTRSFFYPFLIHWFLAVITILLASGALG